MRKNIFFGLNLIAFAWITTSCGTQALQVETGASISRSVIPESAPINTKGNYAAATIGGGFTRSRSYTDNGSGGLSSNYGLFGEFQPTNWLGLGLRPYYFNIDAKVNSRKNIGGELYARIRALQTKRIRAYLHPSIRYSANTANDSNQDCFLFICTSADTPSHAEVQLVDVGLGAMFEIALNKQNSFLFSPQYYWTQIKSSNIYDLRYAHYVDSSGTDAAFMAYYLLRFGNQHMSLLQIGGGVESGGGLNNNTKQTSYVARLGFQFGLFPGTASDDDLDSDEE